MDETLSELGEFIELTLGDKVKGWSVAYGDLTLNVSHEQIISVLRFLRDDARCRFVALVDICGVDWPAREKRFDVVYHLLSPVQNLRIRVKVQTDETTPVPSVIPIFRGAEWFEREAYDMYGILFTGNPDLRRLLTDYGFDGFPLRKDFPLTGYVEVRYDDTKKRVVYEPVQLTQEFRSFDFLSPWKVLSTCFPVTKKHRTEARVENG